MGSLFSGPPDIVQPAPARAPTPMGDDVELMKQRRRNQERARAMGSRVDTIFTDGGSGGGKATTLG